MDAGRLARWQRLEALLDAALDLPDAAIDAVLAGHGASAGEIEEVRRLLAHDAQRSGPMERLSGNLGHVAHALADLRGRRIGPWRLVELLGEGGMASVWLAARDDGSFDQEVAIKLLRHGLHAADLRRHFGREQAILARLEHPNIARLFDAGLAEDGTPYIVMERVRGRCLTAHCDAAGLDTRARLALFAKVLDAVAYAHRELVVHRDLKPDNILIDAHGQVKLLDFGIAGLVGDDGVPDHATALTPRYAAPEQRRGERAGVRADVSARGVVLHELLSGLHAPDDIAARAAQPMSARLAAHVLDHGEGERIARAHGRAPARLRRTLRGDLDRIVATCLQDDPAARYASVDALHEDIARHLGHRPLRARPPGPLRRAALFVRRHWLPLGAASLVVLALTGGALAALREARRADAQAMQARAAQHEAQAAQARAEAINRFVVGLFEAQLPELPPDRMPDTRQLVDQGIAQARDPATGPPELRADLMNTLARIVLARLRFDEATLLTGEAVALLEPMRDAHPETYARSLRLQGHIAKRRKQHTEQARHFDAALAFAARHLPDSQLHLDLMRDAALTRMDLGDYPGTLEALDAIRTRSAGREDLDAGFPLALASDFAITHHRLGRLDAAAEALADVLARKRALGEPPESIAATQVNLGSNAAERGDGDAARDAFAQALATLAGIDSPSQTRASAWHGLSRIAHERGDFDAALEHLSQSAEEWRGALGLASVEDDFFLPYYRAPILADAGHLDEAIAALEQALQRMHGNDEISPRRLATAQATLAGLWCDAGNPTAAPAPLAAAAQTLEPDDAPALADARARCALAAGDAHAALAALPSTFLPEDKPPPLREHLSRALLLARSHRAAGQPEQARDVAAGTLARLDAAGIPAHHPQRKALASFAIR